MVSNLTTVISRTNSTNQMRQKTKNQMKIFETQILLVAVGFTLRQDTELFLNHLSLSLWTFIRLNDSVQLRGILTLTLTIHLPDNGDYKETLLLDSIRTLSVGYCSYLLLMLVKIRIEAGCRGIWYCLSCSSFLTSKTRQFSWSWSAYPLFFVTHILQ